LSSSGQNIYPEELESALNNLPYVVESVVVQKQDKIIGLVYPDWERAEKEGLSEQALQSIMNENLKTLNQQLPNYSTLSEIRLQKENFEKTPKH
jgi:long-chain acyl-CoA synthetase